MCVQVYVVFLKILIQLKYVSYVRLLSKRPILFVIYNLTFQEEDKSSDVAFQTTRTPVLPPSASLKHLPPGKWRIAKTSSITSELYFRFATKGIIFILLLLLFFLKLYVII